MIPSSTQRRIARSIRTVVSAVVRARVDLFRVAIALTLICASVTIEGGFFSAQTGVTVTLVLALAAAYIYWAEEIHRRLATPRGAWVCISLVGAGMLWNLPFFLSSAKAVGLLVICGLVLSASLGLPAFRRWYVRNSVEQG